MARRDQGSAAGLVVVAVADETLLEEILGLCAAAGMTPRVTSTPDELRELWVGASLLLLDLDLARRLGRGPVRRDDVVLVLPETTGEDPWQVAVAIGAADVALLPSGSDALMQRLGAAGMDRHGSVVGVLGAQGGTGASVLAASLAVTAAAGGARCALIDADPLGGGVDLLLGAEQEPGTRWNDVVWTSGRLEPESFLTSLPSANHVRFLAWDREHQEDLATQTVVSAVDAARRAADLVVIDIPRHVDEATRAAMRACSLILVVVRADLSGVVCARRANDRIVTSVGGDQVGVALVARGAPNVVSGQLGQMVGLPVLGQIPDEPGLVTDLDCGLPPAARSRSRLRRASRRLLEAMALGPGAA